MHGLKTFLSLTKKNIVHGFDALYKKHRLHQNVLRTFTRSYDPTLAVNVKWKASQLLNQNFPTFWKMP